MKKNSQNIYCWRLFWTKSISESLIYCEIEFFSCSLHNNEREKEVRLEYLSPYNSKIQISIKKN